MDQKRTRKAAEDLAQASRESYRTVISQAFAARESNARVTRSFFEDTIDALHDQTESNLRVSREFADRIYLQQEALLGLSCEFMHSYGGFLDSPAGYRAEPTEKT